MKWNELPIVKETSRALYDMWDLGWNERNSGNISIRLNKEEYADATDLNTNTEWQKLSFEVPTLANECFLVSSTGEYFRNAINNTRRVLGIIQIDPQGVAWRLLGGYEQQSGTGKPTSELPSHLMCHETRKKISKDRVVLHVHATNLIALMGVMNLTEAELSYTLWNACTESVVVFPQGVGVLPWMMPGSLEIGRASSEKMKEFSLVLWSQHGVYGAGENIESTFGLIETAEKSAEVTLKMLSVREPINIIGTKNLRDIAKVFNVNVREDFLK